MGLIKGAVSSVKGIFGDQWKEYFYCDALPAEVLMRKGRKKTGRYSTNRKGSDNIISNGSVIAVNEGQCMLIVDQGKVVEFCAEPGEFVYDTSTSPSVFSGNLEDSMKSSIDELLRRFSFGGDTGKDQRVYFINIKELTGCKYGTANPVPFRVVDANIGLDMDISVTCYGIYSYRISDPILFYTNVCGNVAWDYTRDQLEPQMKSELLTALQPAFAKVSAMGIRYSALPGHTIEMSNALNEILSDKWKEQRGIEIVSFGVSAIRASKEDEEMLKQLQRDAVYRNPNMAAAHLVGAQADAMKSAASNSGGAMMGFMGMNMAAQSGGASAQSLFQMGAEQQAMQGQTAQAGAGGGASADTWTCSCGQVNTGRFCSECGARKPEAQAPVGWTCPTCGHVSQGKFCPECGTKKPAGEPLYRCDKCGWQPEDPAHPPKFCPQCGDPFDDGDIVK